MEELKRNETTPHFEKDPHPPTMTVLKMHEARVARALYLFEPLQNRNPSHISHFTHMGTYAHIIQNITPTFL